MNLKRDSFDQRTYYYLRLAPPEMMRIDSEVTNCHDCKDAFKFLLVRKHHCKMCGNCFCDECSRERYPKDLVCSGFDFTKTVRKNPEYFKEVWSPTASAWHRVCKACEVEIKEKLRTLYNDVEVEKILTARRDVWRMLNGGD